MKMRLIIFSFTFSLLLLAGCAGNSNEETTTDSTENSTGLETPVDAATDKNDSSNWGEQSDTDDATEISSETDDNISEHSEGNDSNKEDTPLAQYSSEEIEYARVWLQLGPNKEIDGLYVRLIPAGTPLNPDDETSLNYPEDVIQLAGSRLIDGSVTYSGNGDGSINVYNVPLRWDGIYPAGEEFYQEMIDQTKLVSIEPSEDEDVISLIKRITVHDKEENR
ncbi:hypothetical protein [Mesobacillus maritimus]|uniref:Lipoprotein n=1 Tax=Mesobacillus maritimus TaxID=1643336 RepID=A0ABS7K6T9_9BACI|nr:hypothetical protein [Mesobacillus maritimus]MBY0097945.1 hypothetical protein [Mesobacillus maritimus]